MSFKLRNWLPKFLRVPLWGDRERWGLSVVADDPCWKEWQKTYSNFYQKTQRAGLGILVNDAGYKIMKEIDLTGKRVLEIGAGDIRHLQYLQGQPKEYVLADISAEMMTIAQKRLQKKKVRCKSILLNRNQQLPLEDESIDVIISFYSLEHLYPLKPYLDDMYRVLKSQGLLVGAIPAEGGLGWGLGRVCTSRRWLKKNTPINPDKVICWEHPNFADDIISALDKIFVRQKIKLWPFSWLLLIDLNLVIQLLYIKSTK